MAKAIDLSIIKVGLEYASFKDFRVRDALSNLLNELQLDLEEVAFDPADQTKRAIQNLEDTITEIETARSPKASPIGINEDDVEGVHSIHNEDEDSSIQTLRRADDEDDSGAERRAKIVNVDAELDDQS